jgi:hypothetical protein
MEGSAILIEVIPKDVRKVARVVTIKTILLLSLF